LSAPQRRFVAAAKQDDDCIADCDEVEAKPGPQGRRVRLLIRQGLGIKLTVEAVDKGNNYAEARRGRSEQD